MVRKNKTEHKNKFDITLRDIIQNIPEKFVEIISGKKAVKILDTSFPSIKERRADAIFELEDGSIFHLEIQTKPDKNMPYRLIEYYVLISNNYPGRKIIQMVLYVGDGSPSMENKIENENLIYSYILKDIKEIECKELMASDKIEDKILAVLCKVEDFERYIKELVEYLMRLPDKERKDYIKKLLIAIDYRPKLKEKLSLMLEERKMPLTITEEMIRQDPFYKKGIEKGIKKGMEKGIKKGKIINLQENIIKAIKLRFGYIPEEMEKRIKSIQEEEKLNTLFDIALTTDSIDKIRI